MTLTIILVTLAVSAFLGWRVGRFLDRKRGGTFDDTVFLKERFGECDPDCHYLVKSSPGKCLVTDKNLWTHCHKDICRNKYFAGFPCGTAGKYTADSLGRTGAKMNYELDRDAIKKRFAKAVVMGYEGKTHILLPAMVGAQFFSLTEGTWGWIERFDRCDWIIRPGDRCEVSDNNFGCFKVGSIFDGFSGYLNYPFRVIHLESGKNNHSDIRPLPQISEEKADLQESVVNMKCELAAMECKLERME